MTARKTSAPGPRPGLTENNTRTSNSEVGKESITLTGRRLPACPVCSAPDAVYFKLWNLMCCGRCADRPLTREEVERILQARSERRFDEIATGFELLGLEDFWNGCDPEKMPDPPWLRGEVEVRDWRDALPALFGALSPRLAVRVAYHWARGDTRLGHGQALREIERAVDRYREAGRLT